MHMQKFEICITQNAEQDLEDIYYFIKADQLPPHADKLLDALVNKVDSLAAFSKHGLIPKELFVFGVDEFSQIFFNIYRIIYSVEQTSYMLTSSQMLAATCRLYLNGDDLQRKTVHDLRFCSLCPRNFTGNA